MKPTRAILIGLRYGLTCACVALPLEQQAAELRPTLPPEQRTNGQTTLAPLQALRERVAAVTVSVVDARQKPIATGTWVGADGYLLTKASELPRLDTCQVSWQGRWVKLREVRRDAKLDLVLAQAVGAKGTPAAVFANSSAPLRLGQWLVAPSGKRPELRLGVLSALRRSIPGAGAAIGVRMDDGSAAKGEKKGVRIVGVAEDSPAAAAGLRADDWMLELAGESIEKYQRVHEIISKRQPGEEIEVRYRRGDEVRSVQVRLASRTKVLANWGGEDFANGGISIRTDNFTQVLQHDLPLHPTDMGGPLEDLEGGLMGINIARVDRVTTFALPAELFGPALQQWLAEDRNRSAAVAPVR